MGVLKSIGRTFQVSAEGLSLVTISTAKVDDVYFFAIWQP